MVKIVEKSAEERERDRKRNEQYEVLVSLTGEVLGLKEDQGINTLMSPLVFRIMDPVFYVNMYFQTSPCLFQLESIREKSRLLTWLLPSRSDVSSLVLNLERRLL